MRTAIANEPVIEAVAIAPPVEKVEAPAPPVSLAPDVDLFVAGALKKVGELPLKPKKPRKRQ